MSELRILVVDDDPWILRMVTTVLEKRGFSVETADNGEEAYEKAVASPPNLLITDVMMPSMDGWALVKALRGRPEFAFVPVIFLTALGSEDDRIRGFRLGADDYLPKPFRFEELDLRVAKTMERVRIVEAAARAQLQVETNGNGSQEAATKESDDKEVSGIAGSLGQVGISSLLVLMEMERKTGILTLQHEPDGEKIPLIGQIYLRNGNAVTADLADKDLRNEQAIYFMLEWSNGTFRFSACDVDKESEIQTSTTGILMEGARRIDERAREG